MTYLDTLKKYYILHSLVFSIIGLVAYYVLQDAIAKNYVALVTYLFLFVSFDCIGYGIALEGTGISANYFYGDTKAKELAGRSYMSYRILQTILQIVLLLVFIQNLFGVLAIVVVWWFGFADILYYLMLKVPINEQHFNWMENWSVHWLLKKADSNYKCQKKQFLGFGVFGLITGLGVCLLKAEYF